MTWHQEHARANLLAADRLLDQVRCWTSALTRLDAKQRRAVVDLCYSAEAAMADAVRILDGAPPRI